MYNKKGSMGLNIAIGFMVAILIAAILGVVILITTDKLSGSSFEGMTDKTSAVAYIVNETQTFVNGTGNATSVAGLFQVALSSVIVTNATSGVTVPATNYTVSGGTIIAKGGSGYLYRPVNVSASYTYTIRDHTLSAISSNLSNGVLNFFGNATTWFALLSVLVIIAIIAAVIYIVKKLDTGSESGGSDSEV